QAPSQDSSAFQPSRGSEISSPANCPPKSECRYPKFEFDACSKPQTVCVNSFQNSNFGIVSSFEFRISNFSSMPANLTTDILILGTGGAGLMAALHAFWRDPSLDITLVSKGMLGKSGCTRMVQGGYNVVLNPNDSIQAHFEDTVRGGAFLNDQDLAWTL